MYYILNYFDVFEPSLDDGSQPDLLLKMIGTDKHFQTGIYNDIENEHNNEYYYVLLRHI